MLGDIIYKNGDDVTLCDSVNEVKDLVLDDINNNSFYAVTINGKNEITIDDIKDFLPTTWEEMCFHIFHVPSVFISNTEEVKKIYDDWKKEEENKREKCYEFVDEWFQKVKNALS